MTGRAHAEPNTPNASLDTQFTTNIELDIQLNGQPVTAGTVTITSKSMSAGLALTHNAGGQWQGDIPNYDEVYELNVTAGADKISGVYVDGPDIHTFTQPMAGASIDVTMMTNVSWNRNVTAQEARFSVGDTDGLVIADSGSYTIPPLTLHYEKGQTRPNTLRLTRSNSVVPKGGAAGSMFTVSIANELDVVALACATCP